MKILQLAVASIVDVNTGYGLDKIDYTAAEQRARSIRARSVSDLLTSIRRLPGKLFAAYRERARRRHSLKAMAHLDGHLLKDIGLMRSDLIAVELGLSSLEEIGARHHGYQSADQVKLAMPGQTDATYQELKAVNQAYYLEAKCA